MSEPNYFLKEIFASCIRVRNAFASCRRKKSNQIIQNCLKHNFTEKIVYSKVF